MVTGKVVPERGRRIFEDIYDQIRSDLASGALKPGDKLPAERELAEKLGFSRSAVREALRALEASGIVYLQKGVNGGAFIHTGQVETVSRSITDIMVLGNIPLRQVMGWCRSLLLGRAVQLACERGKDKRFRRDRDQYRRNGRSAQDDPRKRFRHIRQFYSLLGRASGNQVLELLIDATTSISLDFAAKHHIEWTPELVPMQQAVLGRLRVRDGEGAARAIGENDLLPARLRHRPRHGQGAGCAARPSADAERAQVTQIAALRFDSRFRRAQQ